MREFEKGASEVFFFYSKENIEICGGVFLESLRRKYGSRKLQTGRRGTGLS